MTLYDDDSTPDPQNPMSQGEAPDPGADPPAPPPERDGRGRFKKNSSGNLKGRPVFLLDAAIPSQLPKMVLNVRRQKRKIKQVDGTWKTMTLAESVIYAIYLKAAQGQPTAIRQFLDLERMALRYNIETRFKYLLYDQTEAELLKGEKKFPNDAIRWLNEIAKQSKKRK